MEETESLAAAVAVEDAKRRCRSLSDRLTKSKLSLSDSPKDTLLRLIQSELNFLHRLSATSHSSPLSLNIGHLESVVHVLQQPFITGVSRVCKSIRLSPSSSIYVDIVCSLNGNPVWFIVSDRNPRYISWEGSSSNTDQRLKKKIQQVVDAARRAPVALQPSLVMLFFSNGLDDNVCQKLAHEFGGVYMEFVEAPSYEELEWENEWVSVEPARSFSEACIVEIKVDKDDDVMKRKDTFGSTSVNDIVSCKRFEGYSFNMGTSLYYLIDTMKCWCCSLNDCVLLDIGSKMRMLHESELMLVNFGTTALVAIVSGISNDVAEKILATPKSELSGRFKGNYEFMIAQITSENQIPIHLELFGTLSRKRGIICESVYSQFQDLISMVGGPNEKLRARFFLKFLQVVADCPSKRMMSLPTTGNLPWKNKVVFGTGDHWNAPTLTANMAFVRAVEQTGMSLSIIKHRPRALVGH